MFTAIKLRAALFPAQGWFDDTLSYLQRPVQIVGGYRT